MKTIPFMDLRPEYEQMSGRIDAAIRRVIKRGRFIMGEELWLFEEEFARYIGVNHAIGVNSGSDALFLALRALGVGRGDEVVTASHSFISTADAITRNGATPIFVDIDPSTYCLDVSRVESAITRKTRAIIPVHLYGHTADMPAVLALARKHKLHVIEDACQAQGAEYRGKKAGSFGRMGCFSFYPTKNLGAYGDGGMVTTNSSILAGKIRKLRNYGETQKYFYDQEGINSRLDELQAAILRVKLRSLDARNERRRRLAALYDSLLEDADVITPQVADGVKHAYYLYVIRCRRRDALRRHLLDNGIAPLIHYPIPIHRQKAYRRFNVKRANLAVTEECAKSVLSLPLYPELDQASVTYIAEAVRRFGRKAKS
jgi:dTDP-4-amino-4,6-dideoxygalactose transaminase